MKKRAGPFRLLVLLVCNFASIIPAQNEHDALPGLVTVESRRRALVELQVEQERLRNLGDIANVIRTTNRIGEVQLKLRDIPAAKVTADYSLMLARQLAVSEHQPLLVDSLIHSARVHIHQHDNRGALLLLDEARSRSIKLTYKRGEAKSWTHLGVAYSQLFQLPAAEQAHAQAINLWRQLNDKQGEARALTNQGETFMLADKPAEANVALREAEKLWREVGNPIELATTLIDLNFLAIRQGQWQQALGLLGEAHQLVNDPEAEPYLAGQIATSFGEAHEAYGQLNTALSYFQEAVTLYRDSARDQAAAIDAASKAGRVQARLGDYDSATRQVEEGLQLAREIDDPLRTGLCHEELGKIWLTAGANEQARKEFTTAITLFERAGQKRPWARTQALLGQTEFLFGNLNGAGDAYRKSINFFQNVRDYNNEAAVAYGMGKLALARNDLDEAGKHLKRSIELTEQLRENASSKDLRSSFLDSVHDRYETYVEWLMLLNDRQPGKGFDVQAFEASESGRARALLDSVRDHRRELRQVSDPSLLVAEEKLQKEEQRLLDAKAQLVSSGADPVATAEIEGELSRLHSRFEALQAQMNSEARYNELFRPASVGLKEIRARLVDQDTALIEYALGSRQSYVWLLTADRLEVFKLPAKQQIEKSARRFLWLVTKAPKATSDSSLQEATAELSQMIVAPFIQRAGSRRLIVVPDGILQYVPFQALSASPSNEALVDDHEIVYAPSAATLATVRDAADKKPAGAKLIAAFGDPRFPSDYVAQNVQTLRGASSLDVSDAEPEDDLSPSTLQRLFFAKAELAQLRNFTRNDGSVIYSDFNATRENLKNLNLTEYRILHFATHGFFNSRQPELSGLFLSQVNAQGQQIDGFVGLADIYKLRAPVDLVVLSACRTGLGKEVRGEGLVGITRGFMYAGASTVVASLWKVDDEATSELMKHFYSNLLEAGMTPAAALKDAQNKIRQQPQWRSPFYWAAFTLQGDYNQVIHAPEQKSSRAYLIIVLVLGLTGLVGLYAVVKRFRRAHLSMTNE